MVIDYNYVVMYEIKQSTSFRFINRFSVESIHRHDALSVVVVRKRRQE